MSRDFEPPPLGAVFGRMTVIGGQIATRADGSRRGMWVMRCSCGEERISWPGNVRLGYGRCKACAVKRPYVDQSEAQILRLREKREALAVSRLPSILARVPTSVFDLGRVL